jgi:hypothetical protein
MTYIKTSYAFKNGVMRVYAGHIKPATAIKHGYTTVNLCVHDTSGKGRNETRVFNAPFKKMQAYK